MNIFIGTACTHETYIGFHGDDVATGLTLISNEDTEPYGVEALEFTGPGFSCCGCSNPTSILLLH